MLIRMLIASTVVLLMGQGAVGEPGRVFKVEGRPAARVLFSLGDEPIDAPALETEMGKVFAGVLGEMKGSAKLVRVVEPKTRPRESTPIETRICVAWLFGTVGGQGTDEEVEPAVKRVEIGRTADGWILAREIDIEDDGLDLARLDETRFLRLSSDWTRFRGTFGEQPSEPPGELVELPQPYVASRLILDSDTLRRRIYGRPPTGVAPLDRVLDEERMFIRLPKGYNPDRPAGLLIWINAGTSGLQPLDVFEPALDELGLICASVENAGNSREIVDRLQLMLDCLETVGIRYLIDDHRIYLTGISGGGRSSSILWGCFSDVFTGAVPIVGLNSYEKAPTGTGKSWAKNFMKPRGKLWSLLRKHRLAAITGANDFNETEMKVRIKGMARGGLDVRLVDQPGLGHEMPSPETFAAALSWVDEPARVAAQERDKDAQLLLERALKAEDGTRLLIRVIDTAPWSDAAFKAYDALLGDE
jgi:hypothetical protein